MDQIELNLRSQIYRAKSMCNELKNQKKNRRSFRSLQTTAAQSRATCWTQSSGQCVCIGYLHGLSRQAN